MRSFQPEQLLLLLLFVLVPLFNVLLRWLQRRAQERPRPAPAQPGAAEPVAREKWPVPLPPQARVIEPALPRAEPREPRAAPRPRPVVRRVGPLGGPAAVRRAVIAMTILGPCRGLEEPPSNLARPPAAR